MVIEKITPPDEVDKAFISSGIFVIIGKLNEMIDAINNLTEPKINNPHTKSSATKN